LTASEKSDAVSSSHAVGRFWLNNEENENKKMITTIDNDFIKVKI
jgi:hypothetical protein